MSAARRGPGVSGFAIAIDDKDRRRFMEAAALIAPDVDALDSEQAAELTGTTDTTLRLQWSDNGQAIRICLDIDKRGWDALENLASNLTRF